MASFLNLSFNKKINSRFLLKHVLFSTFWAIGIMIFIFRVDVLLIEKLNGNVTWLKVAIPCLYFLLLAFMFFSLKWYYILAFFLYPILLIFWFVPKSVLSIGKVYLFGSYLTSILSKLANFKTFLLNSFLCTLSIIFLLTINSNWVRWLSIFVASYFYLRYIIGFLKKAFKPPALFSGKIEEKIKQFIENKSPEDSLVISSFIVRKDDEKLEATVLREQRIRRTVLANYGLELLSKRLNGFHGRQAYLVSWIFGALIFLFLSLLFFWFLNFQLFQIDDNNFLYNGHYAVFDFFYYTTKTITYGNIDLVQPASMLARISEISSFFTIGIFLLVIVVSIFLSLKQDKMNENVRLTNEIFEHENLTLTNYMKREYGLEIKAAMKDIKNINESLKNLKDFIDKLF